MVRLTRTALAGAAVGLLSAACETHDAIQMFETCQLLAAEQVKDRHEAVVSECDLRQDVWLVGLGGQRLTREELQQAGIPESVALGLAQEKQGQARWCALEERPRDEAPPGASNQSEIYRRFKLSCVPARLQPPPVLALRAKRIRLAVDPSPSNDKMPAANVTKIE